MTRIANNRLNLIGQKFSRLTVIEFAGSQDKKYTMWKCKCDCGNEVVVRGVRLRNGMTKSCGCYASELKKELNTTHGMSHTKPHMIWCNMRRRCGEPDNNAYHRYGGRGIKVCDRWMESFENFWEDMKDGYSDGMTLDRIDNDGNYCPENCQWATMKEQSNNRRNNTYLTFNDKTLTLSQWQEEVGIAQGTLSQRLQNGWSVEKTLTTPVKTNKNGK